jgi:hypothetical protein
VGFCDVGLDGLDAEDNRSIAQRRGSWCSPSRRPAGQGVRRLGVRGEDEGP